MLTRVLQQLKLDVLSFDEVDDSHSSTVYKCRLRTGEQVYLKIPYTKVKYDRELAAYKVLKDQVSIPDMLDFWPGDEECPGAFILSELKGRPLANTDSPAVAFQVGVLHAAMHEVRPPADMELAGIDNEYPGWPDFVERQFTSFAEDVKELLDGTLYNQSMETFERMKRELPPPDGPCFLHMDFRPANIIVDGDRVSGVIDFESVRFGATEIDFTKLYRDFLSFDTSLYQSYQEGYTSVRPLMDLEAVLPFYQFTDAFNSIGWCARRGIEKNAMFFDKNLSILKSMLL
ncbi:MULTISPECIES: phosphotransferase family protein [Sporosarcina]|uniref:phosphotransferase family protein n=1 Tax=Sporosarcina TaxID=1569 RepID=UPI00058CF3F5|nr:MULTISPECIES: aminoglycoside phosphotransferase family protein [Sporosarcina]WJY27534.1 aminoglycoside phosphotransferase family protein [Sporosarcina sp. 0.2-SM1T-5]